MLKEQNSNKFSKNSLNLYIILIYFFDSDNQNYSLVRPYEDHKVGLEKIARDLNKLSNGKYPRLKDIVAPEKKLVVMIIGNHSAGKSSFINWYVE